MSARVTYERLERFITGRYVSHTTAAELALDLRDERTAHRATEAKLTAALAEVEKLAAFLAGRDATLAATKAKLEAAEKALKPFAQSVSYDGDNVYIAESRPLTTDWESASAYFTSVVSNQGPSANCPYYVFNGCAHPQFCKDACAALTTQEAPDGN